MDTIENYRKIIENIIRSHSIRPSHGAIEPEIIIDKNRNHFELMHIGWDKSRRVHGCVLHIDLIDRKIWIQHDGTYDGVAPDLVEAGIPKRDIILGFHPEHVRRHTEYGVA